MVPADFLTPSLIFIAEMCVVTLSTLRIIFVARGHRYLAPALGFFEVLIWLFAICQVMQNLSEWMCFVAFALGFTLGNYFGILIEKQLALGWAMVRLITHRDASALIEQLRAADFGVTCVDAMGATGQVQIVMSVIKRRHLAEVLGLIETHHPGAFYAVDDLQSASEGIFAVSKARSGIVPFSTMMRLLLPGSAPKSPVGETRAPDSDWSSY